MTQNNQTKNILFFLFAMIGSCLASGCSTLITRTPEPRYYILASFKKTDNQKLALEEAQKITGTKTIIVGPVEIPTYLDRQEIVVKRGPNMMHVFKLSRWAEPLQNGIERVLAQNISAISEGKLTCYPFSMIVPEEEKNFDIRVMLSVYQFEGTNSANCCLDAEYFLTLPNNKEIFHKKIFLTSTMQENSISETIKCQNKLLNELSYIIFQKLMAISKN